MALTDGTGLFAELAWVLQKTVPDTEARREVYDHMLDAFADVGWYDRDEVVGNDPVLDEAIEEREEASEEDEEYKDDED